MSKLLELRKRAQVEHRQRRFQERFGFIPSDEEIAELTRQVEYGEAEFLAMNSLRISLWRVHLDSRPIVVAYDLETDQIATALTDEMWQNRLMFKTPHVKDRANLKETLKEHPAAVALKEMVERMKRGEHKDV